MRALLLIALFLNAALLAGRVWQELPASAERGRGAGPATDERYCADATGDGKLDISDAVSILNFLFTGTGDPPYCIAQGDPMPGGLTEEQAEILSHMSIEYLPVGRYCVDGGGMCLESTEPQLGKVIRFTGVNVQIVNGAGSTRQINGLGNLIVGYDESRETGPGCVCPEHDTNDRRGSHNVIVGGENNFASYGNAVVGWGNSSLAAGASVIGGGKNVAAGNNSFVGGGYMHYVDETGEASLGEALGPSPEEHPDWDCCGE
jgi:hypothetical protein